MSRRIGKKGAWIHTYSHVFTRISGFLFCVWMIVGVLGLGVTPARTTMDFEAGVSKEVSFEVVSSGAENVKVVFSAQGDLAEYISLPMKEGEISGGEGKKSYSYVLNLPTNMEPGLHTGEVVVLQLPGEGTSAGSQIMATLAVVTQVHLYVPYPGKYAAAKMYVYPQGKGDPVRFVIGVVSQGEFDLTSVRANVDIYTKAGEKIDTFNIDPIGVPSGEKKELVYNWLKDVEVGDYIAKASLVWDEGTSDLEEKFSIGSETLELQEIRSNNFKLGEIAKLEMLVENKWSEAVNDVYIETVISNDKGGGVSNFKSSDYNVPAFGKESFVSYWDTAGVLEGDYDAEVLIKYGDKEAKKGLTFEVSDNKLVVIGLGYVISNSEDGGNALVFVLVVIIGVLVLINVVWFMVLRKKLRGK